MAQEQVMSNEGICETVLWLTGGTSSAITKISCIKTACSAATASGDANYTKSAAAGLTEASIATISVSSDSFANDTVHVEHPFTAGAAETVKGHQLTNDDSDQCFSPCCYAGDITVESGDTITVTHKIRLKNG